MPQSPPRSEPSETAQGVTELARAKINLALHVTGARPDGYHLIDSLVVFADLGDHVTVSPARSWSLKITGPMAGHLPGGDGNLALCAARWMGGAPVAIMLDKQLPVAAGIGGGSADAAATLRALHALDGRALPGDPVELGADVPVCLESRACRMSGVGDVISGVPPLPRLHLCLVNPMVPVATGAVFEGLSRKTNPPLPTMPRWSDADALCVWLAAQRNDLEAPAHALAPVIGDVLAALRDARHCRLARMSGSGATCFAIYPSAADARAAAASISGAHPGWWVRATEAG